MALAWVRFCMAMLELHSIEGAACWRAAWRTSELAAFEAIDMAGGIIKGRHRDGRRCCSSSSWPLRVRDEVFPGRLGVVMLSAGRLSCRIRATETPAEVRTGQW